MAVSPPQVAGLTRAVTDVYAEAEYQLVQLIAQHTAKGVDAPDWATRQLDEIYLFRSEAEELMKRVSTAGRNANARALQRAAKIGQTTAANEITRALRASTVPIADELDVVTRTPTRAIANLALESSANLQRTHPRILRSAEDDYREIIARVSGNVLTGVRTQRQILQDALNQFADRGITGFTDARGRRWSMSAYAEMATRTAVTQALVNAHTDELREQGHRYVIVSDNPQECEKCRPFEGKILSINGRAGGKARVKNWLTGGRITITITDTLEGARDKGLYHPNCRHSHTLFMPGISEPPQDTSDPDGAKDREKLRYLERQVRAAKLRQRVALDPDEKRAAKARVDAWNAKIKQHTDTTSAKRQRDRESVKTGNAGDADYRTRADTPPPKPTPTPDVPTPTPSAPSPEPPQLDRSGVPGPPAPGSPEARLGLRPQDAPETRRESRERTNPRSQESIDFRVNCQRVVQSYELRRRGYEVQANRNNGSISLPLHKLEELWVDADGQTAKYLPGGGSFQRLRDQIQSLPIGARGQIFGEWRAGSSHVWNFEVGKDADGNPAMRWIEAQVDEATAQYVKRLDWGSVKYMRTDDKTPNVGLFKRWRILAQHATEDER